MKMQKNIYHALIATGVALIALLLSYVVTNLDIALSGEKTVLKYWNAFSEWLASGRERSLLDDVVFINVSYDKQLVEITDDLGIPVGKSTVTDRGKLQRLLQVIDSSRTYQYVMLDVFFEDGYSTKTDSALFSLIAGMDRIVIPVHSDGKLSNDVLFEKAAYADYWTSINENDFTKLPLLYKNAVSMPLEVYADMTGRSIRKTLFWYSDGNNLSRRVVFPKMYVRADSPYRSDGQKSYLNLGTDVLDCLSNMDWTNFFKEKFVVIGSFSGEDIHSTYAGDVPGCLVSYNAYLSLMKGRHHIPLGLAVLYFLIFFTMAYMMLFCSSRAEASRTWVWAKLFVLYSAVLTTVCIIIFEIWGQANDIFITSTFFSIVDTLNRGIKTKKNNYA